MQIRKKFPDLQFFESSQSDQMLCKIKCQRHIIRVEVNSKFSFCLMMTLLDLLKYLMNTLVIEFIASFSGVGSSPITSQISNGRLLVLKIAESQHNHERKGSRTTWEISEPLSLIYEHKKSKFQSNFLVTDFLRKEVVKLSSAAKALTLVVDLSTPSFDPPTRFHRFRNLQSNSRDEKSSVRACKVQGFK